MQGDEDTAQGQVIAIVDDEPEIVRVLEMLLSIRGLRVSAHVSAESLLDALSFNQGQLMVRTPDGQVHVLAAAVIDLNLPGMSGAELVLRLRAMVKSLRIVMITAASERLQHLLHTELEIVTVLSKPFSIESFEAALRSD